MRFIAGLVTLGWLMTAASTGQEKTDGISLKEVRYDGLKEVILKNRGKVVLVDFWFNT